jgi:hypothetical protein
MTSEQIRNIAHLIAEARHYRNTGRGGQFLTAAIDAAEAMLVKAEHDENVRMTVGG